MNAPTTSPLKVEITLKGPAASLAAAGIDQIEPLFKSFLTGPSRSGPGFRTWPLAIPQGVVVGLKIGPVNLDVGAKDDRFYFCSVQPVVAMLYKSTERLAVAPPTAPPGIKNILKRELLLNIRGKTATHDFGELTLSITGQP